MSYRVQWRERTPKGNPSTIRFEDDHDLESAAAKLRLILAGNPPCWVWIEDLASTHRGNSSERPKAKAIKGAKR